MDRIRNLVNFVLTLVIVGGFIAVIWLAVDALGAWDVYRAQMQARQAEADAARLRAKADVLRERQAMVQTWVTSFASAKDSLLVTFTYLAGGLTLVGLFVLVVLLLIDRGKRDERTNA